MQLIIKEFSPRERENINICLNRLCRFGQRVMANGNHEIYDISDINIYSGRGKIFCCGREKKERAYIELIDTTKRLISTISVGLDEYVIFEINNYEISIFVEHASIDETYDTEDFSVQVVEEAIPKLNQTERERLISFGEGMLFMKNSDKPA